MKEIIWFAYLVNDIVPEFMPCTAFRRAKHFKTAGRKIIKCPYCGSTFTTVDMSERVEIFCHSTNAQMIWHDAMPCKTCRKIVGIASSLIEAVRISKDYELEVEFSIDEQQYNMGLSI